MQPPRVAKEFPGDSQDTTRDCQEPSGESQEKLQGRNDLAGDAKEPSGDAKDLPRDAQEPLAPLPKHVQEPPGDHRAPEAI